MARPVTKVIASAVGALVITVACSTGNDSTPTSTGSALAPGQSGETAGDGSITTEQPTIADDSPPEVLAALLRNGPNPEALVIALAQSGVRTFRDGTRDVLGPLTTTPVALTLTEFQVDNLARDLASGTGYRGSDLDSLTTTEQLPGLSFLLAAYVQSATTSGARISLQLLGDADLTKPKEVVFPGAVLAFFVADVLGRGGAGPVAPPANSGPARSVSVRGAAGPCGYVSDAMEEALEAITDPETYGGGWFGSIMAGAAGIAMMFAPTVAELIANAPGMREIRQIMAAASVVVAIGSLLRNWSLELTSDGSVYHYRGGGGSPGEGTFTARVDAGESPEFPESVRECASLAGLPLPEPTGAEGSGVRWTEVAGWGEHATTREAEEVLDENGTARLSFTTTEELPLDHEYGQLSSGTVVLSVTIDRSDVKQVQQIIATMLTRAIAIPGIGPVVEVLVGLAGDALADVILNPNAQTAVTVDGERRPWKATFTQTGTGGGALKLDATSCRGLAGPWTMNVSVAGFINGSTTTTWTFDSSGTSAISWRITLDAVEGIADAFLEWSGSATLAAGPVIRAEGSTKFLMEMDDFEDATSNTVQLPWAMGTSADSVVFTLEPLPSGATCTEGTAAGS